jgi:cell division protein FtsQ
VTQWSAPNVAHEVKRKKGWARKLVFVFFLFLGLVILLESPLTRVRDIAVTGNKSVPAAAILAAAPLHKGISLWQVNAGATNQAITSHQPMISAVSVATNYLNGQVVLHVSEKHIVAILDSSGKFYNLLNDGKVYNEASAHSGFIWPIVTMDGTGVVASGQVTDQLYLVRLCKQIAGMSGAQAVSISEIHVNSFGEATVYLNDGFVAQCKVDSLANVMGKVQDAVHYFLGKGYAPGLIDMTGAPPYRYTPFQQSSEKGSQP